MLLNSRIQTQNAVSAVHLLLQSAQATLPKQKRNMAISEYKNAIVSYKRRSQAHHHVEEDHVEEGGQTIFKKWHYTV